MKYLGILFSIIAGFSIVAEAEWIDLNEYDPTLEIAPYYYSQPLSYRYVGSKTDEVIVVDLLEEIGLDGAYYSFMNQTLEIPSHIMIDGVSKPVVGLGHECFRMTKCDKIILPSTIRFLDKSTFIDNEISEIVLSEGLSHIGDQSFTGCHLLKTITLPNSLSVIGNGCFRKCGLESITFGKGLVSIGNSNFNNCNNLEEVILPDGLLEMGADNFNNCANLKRVVIPWCLMLDECFNECPEIEEIVIGKRYWGALYNTFNKVDKSKCRLVVPAGSEEWYKTSYGWRDFTNIVGDATLGIENPQPEDGNEIENTELYLDMSGMPITDPSTVNGIVFK